MVKGNSLESNLLERLSVKYCAPMSVYSILTYRPHSLKSLDFKAFLIAYYIGLMTVCFSLHIDKFYVSANSKQNHGKLTSFDRFTHGIS
jgi:hypothetical protein